MFVSLQTSQVQKKWQNPLKPPVRACTHTPLWSINIFIYCTHVTKIEGLLTHFSLLSYVCVRFSFERWHVHTQLRRRLQILYIIQPWKQPCFTLLNIYIYIYIYMYQLIRIIYIYIALYIHSCFVKFPYFLWTGNSNCSISLHLSNLLYSFLHTSPFFPHWNIPTLTRLHSSWPSEASLCTYTDTKV